MENNRQAGSRKSVNLLVRLAEPGADNFVEKFATNISSGGLFIWSREPRPPGTLFEVRVELAGGARLLQGIAVVRWVGQPDSVRGAPGMGLEFLNLDPASAALIDRITGRAPAEPPTVSKADRAAWVPPRIAAVSTAEAVKLRSQVRAPAAASTSEAVDIDLEMLVLTTPAPPPEEKAGIFVDPTISVSASARPPLPTRSPSSRRTRGLSSAVVPRAVLSASPVRESRPLDRLAFLEPPQDFQPDSPVIGIDLGTSNACCAVLSNGKPVVLKTRIGSNVIPSLVAVNKQSSLVVGYAAHAELLLNPARCIYGSKRLMGRDFDSPAVDAVKARFHYEVVRGQDGKAAVALAGRVVSIEEVQAIILTECRLMAEAHLSTRVSRAVVTCPAYFTEQQRQSIRTAGRLAGLKVERILIEPTAAALAYGMNQELSRRVLVYDVGGGTFDATLLRIEKNVFEVLASGSDAFLGGLDFDAQLIESLVKKFEDEHRVLFSAEPGALARIADQAERAKIALSGQDSVEVQLPMLQLGPNNQPLGLACSLTRQELEHSCGPLVERTIEVVKAVLNDGGLKPADVDEVVLVGGMSRMPMVRKRLKALFKKAPHASVNAEEAVAVGAALYCGVIDKVSNLVLIDVAPMSLGIGLPGGKYRRVINRNSPLPVVASIGLATTEEMTDVLEVSVFQGEDCEVSLNDYVGTIRVDGLPRGPRGLVKVAINFRLDADCVLHVDARELHTRRLFTSALATRYTNAEVQRRLGIKPRRAQAAGNTRADQIWARGRTLWSLLRGVLARPQD